MPHLMLASSGEVVAVIGVAGGISIAILGVIASAIRSTILGRQHEQSRREIAAYIAEGSMTPDEGERLLKANARNTKRCGW